jgi:hypothetical protein
MFGAKSIVIVAVLVSAVAAGGAAPQRPWDAQGVIADNSPATCSLRNTNSFAITVVDYTFWTPQARLGPFPCINDSCTVLPGRSIGLTAQYTLNPGPGPYCIVTGY